MSSRSLTVFCADRRSQAFELVLPSATLTLYPWAGQSWLLGEGGSL